MTLGKIKNTISVGKNESYKTKVTVGSSKTGVTDSSPAEDL